MRAGLALIEQRYRVVMEDPGIFAATGYLAGDDQRRADELNRYLANPDIRAILVGRGGYGIMRIADQLDAAALRRDPKLIVGFSDATALICWASTGAGVRAIHGPVVAQLGDLDPADVSWLVQLMEKTSPAGEIAAPLAPIGAVASGRRAGRLRGGNLCILSHLVATPLEVDLAGAIVAFEDVGERPYAVDRYLTRLWLAGRLGEVAAMVAGDFVSCDETVGPPEPEVFTVIDERLRAFGCPGLRGLPVGHANRNLALPFGARCEIDFDRLTLELLEPAVM